MTEKLLKLWKTPTYYMGYNPTSDYIVLMKHRDSDLLSISNFHVAHHRLTELAKKFEPAEEQYDAYGEIIPSDWAYVWSASCWAHGFRDYLMIRGDAPQEIIDLGEILLQALDSYPILDETDYEERQDEVIQELWRSMDDEERKEIYIKTEEEIPDQLDYPIGDAYYHLLESL